MTTPKLADALARATLVHTSDALMPAIARMGMQIGHDYKGLRVSCIGQERSTNPRLAGLSRDEFISVMNTLRLPPPARMAEALPANLRCGDRPGETIIDLHAV